VPTPRIRTAFEALPGIRRFLSFRSHQSYGRPLASVRYNRGFFEGLIEQGGFRLESYDKPSVRKAQRGLILSKASR
jgi:hypothetical protein